MDPKNSRELVLQSILGLCCLSHGYPRMAGLDRLVTKNDISSIWSPIRNGSFPVDSSILDWEPSASCRVSGGFNGLVGMLLVMTKEWSMKLLSAPLSTSSSNGVGPREPFCIRNDWLVNKVSLLIAEREKVVENSELAGPGLIRVG